MAVSQMDGDNKQFPKRKPMRLGEYDYSTAGAYFITICTEHKQKILSEITVGAGVPDCPQVRLLKHGEIADKYLRQLHDFYDNISIDKYVIMPNHIHFILTVTDGQSGTPVPTKGNAVVAKFVSTFKRFCNKEYGENIWQSRYHDHVIRGEQDYREIWQYIDNNPLKWALDRYYTEQ